jgi:anti-anti-sigma factor
MQTQAFSTAATQQQPILISAPEHLSFEWRHVFRPILREATRESRFVIDFTNTQSVDTAALGMLLQLEEKVDHNPGALRMTHVGEQLRSLFEVAGLTGYLV